MVNRDLTTSLDSTRKPWKETQALLLPQDWMLLLVTDSLYYQLLSITRRVTMFLLLLMILLLDLLLLTERLTFTIGELKIPKKRNTTVLIWEAKSYSSQETSLSEDKISNLGVVKLSPVTLLNSMQLMEQWKLDQDPQLWKMLRYTTALRSILKKLLFGLKVQQLNIVRLQIVPSTMDIVGVFTSNHRPIFYSEITSFSILDLSVSSFRELKMLPLITM